MFVNKLFNGKSLLIILLLIALVAPFTFLKPIKSVVKLPVKIPEIPVEVIPKVVIEKPLHQVAIPDFANIKSVKEKKRRFFNFIQPAVAKENQRILLLRQKVQLMVNNLSLELALSSEELITFNQLVKQYKVNKKYSQLQQAHELLKRIDIIPEALVLVQAANESAWGTSRFARIGLNFFGLWCYKQGCGMVPNGRVVGAKHEVAAFNSLDEGVHKYLHNINTNYAYEVFRSIRAQLRAQNQPLSPQILATGLLKYSERGADYVLELTQMIRHNRAYLQLDMKEQ